MTLTITLNEFRYHKNYTLILRQGITHLSGRNGAGKSTIAAAIRWALYGSLRKVTPREKPKAKTSVNLLYEDDKTRIEILRVRGGRLLYKEEETTREGEEAQSHITRRFGTESVWMSTCYVPQKRPHPLIAGSSADVSAMIYSLSCSTEDPREIGARISSSLNSAIAERNQLLSLHEPVCDHPSCPPTTPRDLVPLRAERERLNADIIDSIKCKSLFESGLVRAKKREELMSTLESIPVIHSSTSELKRELEMARRSESTTSRRVLLESQLASSTVLTMDPSPALSSYIDAWRRMQEGGIIIKRYGLSYDEDEIKQRLSLLEGSLQQYESHQYRAKRRESLNREIERIPASDVMKKREELRALENELALLANTTTGKTLSCPVCQSPCTLQGDELIAGASTHSHDELKMKKSILAKSIQRCRTDLSSMESHDDKKRRLQSELDSISILPVPMKKEQADEMIEELAQLRRVRVVLTPPHSLQEIEKEQSRRLMQAELDSLPQSQRPVPSIEHDLREIARREEVVKRIQELSEKRSSQEVQLELDNVIKKIQELENKSQLLSSTITSHERDNEEYEKHRFCDHRRKIAQNIQELDKRVDALTRAFPLSQSVYHDMVMETIKEINKLLVFTCSRLFDTDISLRIVSVRAGDEVKGRARQRTTMQLRVVCNGVEDDIDSLSGGEDSRASLAVSLAIAIYSSPLFIVLDEPFEGVTTDCQDVVLDLLKELIPRTPCLLLTHTDVGSGIDVHVPLDTSHDG